MDVVVWLRSLGLEEYEADFRENKIDDTVLPNLTAEDLKDLGVTAVGHRRKLVDAIAALRNDPSVQAASVTVAPARPSLTPSATAVAEAIGERRHVTVMFCDLVGSTSIAAALDAEDWRDLVGSYLDDASAAVTEMGGHVSKKLGDGLMALFGYPVAQENDAERAVRAALSIQRSLADINRKNTGSGKPALNARIGIETGPVVVDAAGEIYGDAPNTAARVQALAEPDTVLVTARVQRQIAGLFVAEERGTHSLKGVPDPVTLFRLVRASGGGRRAGQRHLTPLIGREEEIAVLMRRWERARTGDGQLVLIMGEPGLGKSRLIEEFHTRLGETPHTWVEWSCSQLLQNTALHPIAEWGRQRFGGTDLPAERRLADLENTLALVKLDPSENTSLLAPLLDIPLSSDVAPVLAPEELRRRQLASLTNFVMAGARTQPVVVALEDVHWADPTTLDFIRGIVEQGAGAPLLFLITARPEFRPSWTIRSHHATISLSPLDDSQVREMVAELSARHALPKQIIDGVTARAGGVPLFIEEVTRLLLERGEQSGTQAIPPTLQQSLLARLDRLGPAREVAQIAAVIGRDFSYGLLRAVATMEDVALQSALDRLTEADVLLVQGVAPQSEYRFKHALIQDAAYENLLKSRRQSLHRRTGEVLRDQFEAKAVTEPELLAYHFSRAGFTEAAVEWWGKAGQRSLERSALVEATAQLTRALDQIATAPSTSSLRRQEINLQVALINPLLHVKGYAAPETKAAAERARLLIQQAEAIGEPPEDPLLLFSVLYAFWIGNVVAFRGDVARELAAQFLTLAEQEDSSAPKMIGHRLMGMSFLHVGELAEGRVHLDRAIGLYDAAEHRRLATRFGHDSGVSILCFRSMALWLLGYPEAARKDAEEAVKQAREIGQAATSMYALVITPFTYLHCGDYATANRQLAEAIQLAEQKDAVFWKAWAMMQRGCVDVLSGKPADAVDGIISGTDLWHSTGSTLNLPLFQTYLARAFAAIGRLDDSRRCISEATAAVEATQENWAEAELNRVAGEIVLLETPPDPARAETFFQRALTVARQRQAKSWELRAATSLARLWRDQGKVQQARELLGPVYGWFTEGHSTGDLKEAKALLEELAA
jgi:class 3 adenylate cyclase/predicted ATPase